MRAGEALLYRVELHCTGSVSTSSRTAMICAFLAAALCTATLAANAAEAAPVVIPLFVPTQRHPCFRQPAIINAGGTLLAFAENRNVSACAPELGAVVPNASHGGLSVPLEVGSMLLRRSTDGGESWLPLQSLLAGNIDFYSVVFDAKSHTVWLMVSHSGTTVLSSKDEGATWQQMPSLDQEALSRPPIKVSGPAVGHGVQVLAPARPVHQYLPGLAPSAPSLMGSCCAACCVCAHCRSTRVSVQRHARTRAVSCCHSCVQTHQPKEHTRTKDAPPAIRAFCSVMVRRSTLHGTGCVCGPGFVCPALNCTPCVSADGGKTWDLGAVGQQGTRESQVVQLPSLTGDAHLYASERNMGPNPGDFLRHEDAVVPCSGSIKKSELSLHIHHNRTLIRLCMCLVA